MAKLNLADQIRVARESPNIRELTTQTLRGAILNMYFSPGERLIERKLCEQTGVSRTSVREALRHLETEGLVERVPNRGLFVATVSRDEARQIYEVRAALEPVAGRMFVERAGDETLKELEAAFRKIEKSIADKPVMTHVKTLDGFYDVLFKGAGNEVARRVHRTLRARMNFLRALTAQAADKKRRAGTVAKMRGIVAAAKRRDAEEMAMKCRDFVHRSAEFAAEVLAQEEERR